MATKKPNPDISVYDYMNSKGKNGSYATRKALFDAHFGGAYKGTAQQNLQLIKDLKEGKLSLDKAPDIKASNVSNSNKTNTSSNVSTNNKTTTANKTTTVVPRGTEKVVVNKNYKTGNAPNGATVKKEPYNPLPNKRVTDIPKDILPNTNKAINEVRGTKPIPPKPNQTFSPQVNKPKNVIPTVNKVVDDTKEKYNKTLPAYTRKINNYKPPVKKIETVVPTVNKIVNQSKKDFTKTGNDGYNLKEVEIKAKKKIKAPLKVKHI